MAFTQDVKLLRSIRTWRRPGGSPGGSSEPGARSQRGVLPKPLRCECADGRRAMSNGTGEVAVGDQPNSRVGDEVLIETDTVRVWSLALSPGTQTGLHQHPCDYFYVVVDAGDTETVYPETGETHRHTDQRGDVVHVKRDTPHFLRNIGSSTYRNIVVELITEGVPTQ